MGHNKFEIRFIYLEAGYPTGGGYGLHVSVSVGGWLRVPLEGPGRAVGAPPEKMIICASARRKGGIRMVYEMRGLDRDVFPDGRVWFFTKD